MDTLIVSATIVHQVRVADSLRETWKVDGMGMGRQLELGMKVCLEERNGGRKREGQVDGVERWEKKWVELNIRVQGQNDLLTLVAPLAWVNLGLVKRLQHLSQYWRLKNTIPGLWDFSPLSKQRSEHYLDACRR